MCSFSTCSSSTCSSSTCSSSTFSCPTFSRCIKRHWLRRLFFRRWRHPCARALSRKRWRHGKPRRGLWAESNFLPTRDCYGYSSLQAMLRGLDDVDGEWEKKQVVRNACWAYAIVARCQNAMGFHLWNGRAMHWDVSCKSCTPSGDYTFYTLNFRPSIPSWHDQEVVSSIYHWQRKNGTFCKDLSSIYHRRRKCTISKFNNWLNFFLLVLQISIQFLLWRKIPATSLQLFSRDFRWFRSRTDHRCTVCRYHTQHVSSVWDKKSFTK